MGLTKTFYKYSTLNVFNEVASCCASIVYVDSRHCLIGACQRLYVWNLKTMKSNLVYEASDMIRIVQSCPVKGQYAVGLVNGVVDIVELNVDSESSVKATFAGHKSAVNCLAFDSTGFTLASGGKDASVILWDVVNESGMFRLQGHQAPITHLYFVPGRDTLMSSSKDTTIKFWNLQCKHCYYTLTVSNSEIWSFVCNSSSEQLIVGTMENQLYIYDLEWLDNGVKKDEISLPSKEVSSDNEADSDAETEANPYLICRKFGSVFRHAKGRVCKVAFSPDGTLLFCSATGRFIDVYRAYAADEAQKRRRKKIKKLKENSEQVSEDVLKLVAGDISTRYAYIDQFKVSNKCKDFDLLKDVNALRVLVLLGDNGFEEWQSSLPIEGKLSFVKTTSDTEQGHRTHVRTIKFSNDNQSFLSGSADSVKLWFADAGLCVRTMAANDVLASAFLPNDQHCIVGTKEGELIVFACGSGERVFELEAHSDMIWGVAVTPDSAQVASCSADRTVKFWNFALRKRLELEHSRTLQLDEDVTSMCFSPDGKYIILGLLDNTAKVFFVDTFKFFLCLYGHSLPVLTCDVSFDSTLIVTGSADRSVKIWGLDFGDCHRSLLAHDDSVTCVKFVPRSHLFFSAGKDGKIRQWCADKFVKITVLEGHLAEIWALDISTHGDYVISASHDRSIRMWQKTEELLVLQEEQDLEREMAQTKTLEDLEDVVAGEVQGEASLAAKRTPDVITNVDHVIDAIELVKKEMAKCGGEDAQNHPVLKAWGSPSLECYIVDVLRRLSSSHLEKCLIMLPLSDAFDLLDLLSKALKRNYHTELVIRCSIFLIRIYYCQITYSEKALPILEYLSDVGRAKLCSIRDTVGVNIAALQLMEKELQEREDVHLFTDAVNRFREQKVKKGVKAPVLLKL